MAKDEVQQEAVKAHMGTKTIIIIVISVVVSVALTAGIVLYIVNGKTATASTEKAGEKKGAHGEAAKGKEGPVTYALEPFIVNISDSHDTRYLRVKIELDVAVPKETKAELDAFIPPLRDSILILLTSKTLQDVSDLPGKNRLKEEILATATKILPPGKVSKVYFTDFVVQ